MSAESFYRRLFDPTVLIGAVIYVAALSLFSLAFADDLHDAATNGDLLKIRGLIYANPELISSKISYGETPLICAAEYGHRDVVEWLLLKGADIEGCDGNGATALHWASARGYTDVVELLLMHGAKVDARRTDNITPLIWASNKEVAELLLDHGADVNAEDEDGDTPLTMAEHSHRSDWVELLLAHGAKVELLSLPGLWLRIHYLWISGIAGATVAIWVYYFWNRPKTPAPSRKVRLAWWFGIYLAGSWTVLITGIGRFGFASNPLLLVVEPLSMPSHLKFLLPDPWLYALFEHLPAAFAAWSFTLVPIGVYLLHLVISMYVKRFQTFCALLVLLMFLICLSAFGLAEGIANFPRPD